MASRIEDLEKLAALHEKGLVSSEEFEETKAKLLAGVGQEDAPPAPRTAARRSPTPRPRPRPTPRPKGPPKPRPLPLGLGLPLLLVVPLALLAAVYPRVRFDGYGEFGQSLGFVLFATGDTYQLIIEAVGVLGWLAIGLTALIAGLLPMRRQWMAAIPLGLLLGLKLLHHLLFGKYQLWWLQGVLDGWVGTDEALLSAGLTLPGWLLGFPATICGMGLVAMAGLRLRRPLGVPGRGVLVLCVLGAMASPGLVSFVVRVLLEPVGLAEEWWRPVLYGLGVLVSLVAAVMLHPRQPGRIGAAAYLGLTLVWNVVLFAVLGLSAENLAVWVYPLWGGEELIALGAALCLGLALGQPDSFPEVAAKTDAATDAGST